MNGAIHQFQPDDQQLHILNNVEPLQSKSRKQQSESGCQICGTLVLEENYAVSLLLHCCLQNNETVPREYLMFSPPPGLIHCRHPNITFLKLDSVPGDTQRKHHGWNPAFCCLCSPGVWCTLMIWPRRSFSKGKTHIQLTVCCMEGSYGCLKTLEFLIKCGEIAWNYNSITIIINHNLTE